MKMEGRLIGRERAEREREAKQQHVSSGNSETRYRVRSGELNEAKRGVSSPRRSFVPPQSSRTEMEVRTPAADSHSLVLGICEFSGASCAPITPRVALNRNIAIKHW